MMFCVIALFMILSSNVRVNSQGAGTLRIIVTNQSNVAIAGARVCLVTSAQTIGTDTPANGEVSVTSPVGLFTVYVSKEGFTNVVENVSVVTGTTVVKQFHLVPGTATPLPAGCGIFATTTPGNGVIRVLDLDVVGATTTTNRRLSLRATLDKPAEFFRVTEFTDAERYPAASFNPKRAFDTKNVSWQPLNIPGRMARDTGPRLDGNVLTFDFTINETLGTHFVYVEVKLNDFGGISDPKSAAVTLAPSAVTTYTLSGQKLATFVQQARDRGYQFVTNEEKISESVCFPNSLIEIPADSLRFSNVAAEILVGSFEVFIGPDLNPFWKLKSIDASHHDFPSPSPSGSKPAIVITKELTGSGGPNSIRRTFKWRRTVFQALLFGQVTGFPPQFHSNDLRCVLRSPDAAQLTELKLEGPSGRDPLDALPVPH